MPRDLQFRPGYGHQDDRKGLGYGQLSPRFHVPYDSADSYPYSELTDAEMEANEEPLDDNEKLPAKAHPKLSTMRVVPSDHLAHKGTDPFSYVAGSTKLSENPVRKNSISPIPRLYPNKVSTRSPSPTRYMGPSHGFGTSVNTVPTGKKQGWSKAPEFNGDTGRRIMSLEDIDADTDEQHIEDIRQFVRLVLQSG